MLMNCPTSVRPFARSLGWFLALLWTLLLVARSLVSLTATGVSKSYTIYEYRFLGINVAGYLTTIVKWIDSGTTSYVLVVALPLLVLVFLWIGCKRLDGNVCASCGYDLRATPHRCPECGIEPAVDGGRIA